MVIREDRALDSQGESALVMRAKERSPEAWTEIYNLYYRPIYRYVNARVFDRETTEDLTSSVFLGAIKGIDSYQYRGQPLLAWLYRIARNVVSSHQRRLLGPPSDAKAMLDAPRRVISRLMRRVQPEPSAGEQSLAGATADATADPAALVEQLDLQDALAKLAQSQREIVILRFLVGLTTDEIAGVMEKQPSAVYSLEARALQSLRKLMD